MRLGLALLGWLVLAAAVPAVAETGVTEHEIMLGQTMAYSGPASAYGGFGRVELAYLKMINERGGVHGRTINLISVDDGYLPPKSFEQTRDRKTHV